MYQKEKIIEDANFLQEAYTDQREGLEVLAEIEKLHNNILSKSFKIRKDVDRKLSKFFNRAHPWSPILQQARDRVELWTRTIYSKNRVATSSTIIKRLSIKLKDYSGPHTTKAQAVNKLK